MVDLPTALLAAGLGLAQRLIVVWIRDGRSKVRARERRKLIDEFAAEEATRLRLQVDELERATKIMMKRLVVDSPQLSYSNPIILPSLRLDYDPVSSESSARLIADLRARCALIAEANGIRLDVTPTDQPAMEVVVRVESREDSRRLSQRMLDEMQQRIRDAESRGGRR